MFPRDIREVVGKVAYCLLGDFAAALLAEVGPGKVLNNCVEVLLEEADALRGVLNDIAGKALVGISELVDVEGVSLLVTVEHALDLVLGLGAAEILEEELLVVLWDGVLTLWNDFHFEFELKILLSGISCFPSAS